MNTLTSLADHASAQSDRWLFVALLIAGALAFYFAARWLAGQYQTMLSQWRTDMLAMQTAINSLHTERVNATERYAQSLADLAKQQAVEHANLWKEVMGGLTRMADKLEKVSEAMAALQRDCMVRRQNNG